MNLIKRFKIGMIIAIIGIVGMGVILAVYGPSDPETYKFDFKEILFLVCAIFSMVGVSIILASLTKPSQ